MFELSTVIFFATLENVGMLGTIIGLAMRHVICG